MVNLICFQMLSDYFFKRDILDIAELFKPCVSLLHTGMINIVVYKNMLY